ncbi:MAG TPA: sigma-70 family RNA polymerase sigma factor [Polyangiaceae bacterium]|nr:sigma-70 family RNA polymerase sigma factor [Polyangiaceae bacterium]
MKAPLAAKLAEARALYPELGITEEGFLDAVLRLEDNGASIEHCPDLLLASACARGEAPALLAFERVFGPDVDRAIDKSPRLGIDREEFRQLLRARLFVAEGERPPRITGYRGEGALRSWVRVTAGRLVIDLSRRHHDSERPDDDLARRLATAGDDPELDYLRHAYAEALPSAFAEAVERLTVRQRNLLRQRFLQELTVERLASIYGVHRSTMFEWLAGARESLLKELRAALARRLPEQNLDSVLALMGSQLELSVRRMLDSRLERDENT